MLNRNYSHSKHLMLLSIRWAMSLAPCIMQNNFALLFLFLLWLLGLFGVFFKPAYCSAVLVLPSWSVCALWAWFCLAEENWIFFIDFSKEAKQILLTSIQYYYCLSSTSNIGTSFCISRHHSWANTCLFGIALFVKLFTSNLLFVSQSCPHEWENNCKTPLQDYLENRLW